MVHRFNLVDYKLWATVNSQQCMAPLPETDLHEICQHMISCDISTLPQTQHFQVWTSVGYKFQGVLSQVDISKIQVFNYWTEKTTKGTIIQASTPSKFVDH